MKGIDPGQVVHFTRQKDGLLALEGKFPRGCRWVYSQYRMEGRSWMPKIWTMAPQHVKQIVKLLDSPGPFAYDDYRFIPVQISDDPKRAERLAKLKARPKEPKEKHESELALLVRDKLIDTPAHLVAIFHGKKLRAKITASGVVIFAKASYSSLSMAGAAAKASVIGKAATTNGWTFWSLKTADGSVPLPRAK